MSLRVYLRRLGAVAALVTVLVPAAARAQGGAIGDSVGVPGIRLPATTARRIAWTLPPDLHPIARRLLMGVPASVIAAEESARLARVLVARERELWHASLARPGTNDLLGAAVARADFGADTVRADTARRGLLGGLLGDRPDMGLQFRARFEGRLDRQQNERCTPGEYYLITSQCQPGYLPTFDLQLYTRANGTLADRIHVNVDYDSQREFDASNNVSLYYTGKSHEMLDTLQFGNVSLQLPPSQFITSGIPQGNYGIQAIGQLGPARFRTIMAQQKGHVPKLYEVMVGDRTLKQDSREIEEHQIEARRFFFTVDPLVFGAAYPNVDILDGQQMRALAEALPDDQRPRKLFVYRLLIGGQPPNPNGPRFEIIGDTAGGRGQVYELLRENEQYYTDPSLLWIALQRPLNLQNERLVLAYTLRINGVDTVIAAVGGTPDVSYVPERQQLAHLLWDPQVRPGEPAFRREIRSVYRVAGEDLRRLSVALRIVTGSGAGQEQPLAGLDETYLQMFGLSQTGNPASFDAENRLWPRPGDPNVAIGGAANAKIIRDHFLVLPSIRPFAADGLVKSGNPTSDTVYTTPSEDLYSPLRPPSKYRLLMSYDIEGGGSVGTMTIGAVQLRRFSDEVLVDGVRLVRGATADYTIDYDIGTITFSRPDTLFSRPRRVSVRYEENPLFAAAPTSIFGLATEIPLDRGELGFTWLSQSQRTSFTRPPLGYEPQSSQIAGVTGRFSFEAAPISRFLEKIPTVQTTSLSRIDVQGEFAMSRPQPNSAGRAYVESFEGEGGMTVPLSEAAWFYSSQPAIGVQLDQRFGAETFSLLRASTMAWQNLGFSLRDEPIQYTLPQIDPQVQLTGAGVTSPEQMLWLTLYPLHLGGLIHDTTNRPQWVIENPEVGRRWRSIRLSLGPSGADLSRAEYLEFWTLVDTATARRPTNAALVIDLGDISENSVMFAPEVLTITDRAGGGRDSVFSGKVLMGFNEMNTERDSVSRSFNQARDDKGLPGDVVPQLAVFSPEGFDIIPNYATCFRGAYRSLLLGDARTNCTVGNGRLDEEDVDLDQVLNLVESQRESERVRRYIIDLSNPASYSRIGRCGAAGDTTGGVVEKCWVHVRVPYRAPDDSTSGGPNPRRIRGMRLTLISGAGAADTAYTQVPIARLKLVGSPLIKRSDRTVRGIAGELPSQGYVIAAVIGTQDRDSLRNLDYESPPGVSDAAERQQTGLENVQTQINERSLRLQSGDLGLFERAEAYRRFAEGSQNFMNYREMRVWARGRGNGWGQSGELQFYIKIGRDANNFYVYRTPVNAGPGRATWLPEVRVDFNRFTALRAELHNRFTQESADTLACTGIDSALVVNSGVPTGQPLNRYAVCADGYMAYSVDPAVNPPNLAQVQEFAVGMVRVSDVGGTTPIMPGDTLELWVNDIRLTDVESTAGYAGQLSVNVSAGDVASFRVNVSRRDPHFRQLAETPSFLSNTGIDISTAVRLERLVPGLAGYSAPLSITRSHGATRPLFLSQSDIPGGDIEGLRTPRSDATRYTLSLRRVRPVTGSAWGVLLNNLSVNGTLSHASTRSEYTDGGTKLWTGGFDYTLLANGRFASLPRWMTPGLDRDAPSTRLRLNPTQLRFATDFAHTSDRRRSFLKPVELASDTGRAVHALMFVWRTSASVELRPVDALAGRLDFTSVRDLRDYGDTSATAIVASGERDRALGVDLGLERDRQMNTSLTYTPAVVAWFRPTVTVGTNYSMRRDAQARQLVRLGDSTGAFRLPRRLSSGQHITTSALFDPGRALRTWAGDSGFLAGLADVLQPINVSYRRDINSVFDGAPFTPGLGYQFAYGSLDDFRFLDDRAAAAAGLSDVVSASTTLRLPGDIALSSRAEIQTSRNYARRLDETQSLVLGRRERFPDLLLSWTYRRPTTAPTRWFPRMFYRAFSQFTLTGGMRDGLQSSFSAAETEDGEADRRVTRTRAIPISGVFGVNVRGTVITNFSYGIESAVDSVAGSVTETDRETITIDMNRTFRMPDSWGARSLLRARAGWQSVVQSSYVSVAGSPGRSRLADNGRTAFNFGLNTDVATNVSMELQIARIITVDNNFNRKTSQFMLTAAFTLRHEVGGIR